MQALFPGVYAAEMQIPSEALLILIQTQVALDLEDQMAMPHQHKTPAASDHTGRVLKFSHHETLKLLVAALKRPESDVFGVFLHVSNIEC